MPWSPGPGSCRSPATSFAVAPSGPSGPSGPSVSLTGCAGTPATRPRRLPQRGGAAVTSTCTRFLDEHAAHYNQHRPHRARNLRRPRADEVAPAIIAYLAAPKMWRCRVLGRLINEYEKAA